MKPEPSQLNLSAINTIGLFAIIAFSLVGMANTEVVGDAATTTVNAVDDATQPFQDFWSDLVYPFVAEAEGGYANDSADAGGETNYGIASEFNPGVDVANITQEEAELYKKENYYQAAGCDKYTTPEMALVCGDTAVNFGVGGWQEFESEVEGITDEKEKALAIAEARKEYREQRVQEDPSQEKFYDGWINRDNKLIEEIQNAP